jgi:hypothetical protein
VGVWDARGRVDLGGGGPELGARRRWGVGDAGGSLAMVLGELGRVRSARLCREVAVAGGTTSLEVNSSNGWLGWWLHGETLLGGGNGDGGWCSGGSGLENGA